LHVAQLRLLRAFLHHPHPRLQRRIRSDEPLAMLWSLFVFPLGIMQQGRTKARGWLVSRLGMDQM
jgi:hypothetical protein